MGCKTVSSLFVVMIFTIALTLSVCAYQKTYFFNINVRPALPKKYMLNVSARDQQRLDLSGTACFGFPPFIWCGHMDPTSGKLISGFDNNALAEIKCALALWE